MLKFVFDTNVFVSALISKKGNPALLLDRVRKSYTLFIEMRYKLSGKIKLQHLKALERAPHGTLAFRSYLLRRYSTILCNKAFGGLEALRVK